MKTTTRTLSAVSLALLLGACSTNTSSPVPAAKSGTTITSSLRTADSATRWFVELEGDPTGLSAQSLGSQQASFRAQATQRGIQYQELLSFQTLFNGFSVMATRAEIGRISQMPGVMGVYPVKIIARPKVQRELSAPLSPEMFSAISMTGADIAQNELGLSGKGIKVAVMDSGLDVDHPAFAGRIVAGYDFVGDAYGKDGKYDPIEDTNPDDCDGHGTHVAGIIGGIDAAKGFKGVAPGVSFGAYKVFGCEGGTQEDIMVKAMERAYADGMQVLNMSIGSAFENWEDTPSAKAASRLVKKGMVVVASAGNSGASGQYSMGGVTMGDNVISVASVSNTEIEVNNFTITPDGSKIGYFAATGAPEGVVGSSLPITKKAGSTPTTVNDGCTASGGFAAGSLTGKAVLIRRGTCTFYEKAFNAQSAGAKAVILYNNAPGYLSPTVAGAAPITIPVVSISAADGAKIDGLIAGGITMTFNAGTIKIPSPTANTLDSFSSYGMSAELELKPDVAAPGGNIRSTYPLSAEASGYATLSGTSMSSPHVAGAAALMLQAFPNTKAKDMRGLLMNSATLRWYRAPNGTLLTGLPDYVQRQGAGMLDIVASYNSTVRAVPNKLSLGESASFASRNKVVVLRNTWTRTETFKAFHYPALTIEGTTLAPLPADKYATMTINGTAVDKGELEVVVPGGGEKELNVVITPPATAADKAQYGGYIVLQGNSGNNLVIPYGGFKGDYQSIKVLGDLILGGKAYDFPALFDDKEDVFYTEGAAVTKPIDYTFTDFAPDPAKPSELLSDAPYVVVQRSHQSRRMTVDLLDGNGNLVQTLETANYLGRHCTNNTALVSASCDGYDVLGWDGKLGKDKAVTNAPNGTYQIRVKVLKALGDESNPADTEVYSSQKFNVARP